MNILGISAFYHDSAAALLRDGEIVAAAQEERFSRRKHDADLPERAIRYCLAEGDVGPNGLDAVAFYDKPILKFSRMLQTYFGVAPRGLASFVSAMPVWMKRKLWIPPQIEEALNRCGVRMPPRLYFFEHHLSHAASAFYPSPFQTAAILTLDGVGEWAATTIRRGDGSRIDLLKEQRFPHSLGLLYSAFTYFAGFKVNSGEYKLMGLAPYGEPKYADLIREGLIDLKEDGSFRLNMRYFGYLDGLTMTNRRFEELFGGPPRKPEEEITQRETDLARSIQEVTEEVLFRTARHAVEITGERRLCIAGGVALNSVANGKLLRSGIVDDLWIQPASDDAGGALGAAMLAWHQVDGQPRRANGESDAMKGAFLGPEFDDAEIGAYLAESGYPARKLDPEEWPDALAQLIAEGGALGLLSGRMEFGPRALGARSILGDPRSPKMQSIMNLKIKYRESFRPFAPSCLIERCGEYFDLDSPSPYMLLVAPVREERRVRRCGGETSMRERINEIRSDIPAVTHVDYSSRIQTVDRRWNPRYYDLIRAFERRTGCGVLINTSFNVRGEPIVCTPEDAYRCFMRTEMDYLALGSYLLDKREQPPWSEARDWRRDHVLD
jgi:carbamoyltransferase